VNQINVTLPSFIMMLMGNVIPVHKLTQIVLIALKMVFVLIVMDWISNMQANHVLLLLHNVQQFLQLINLNAISVIQTIFGM